MQQVILNLLRNAIEASPPGGTIRITAATDGNYLIVEISNAVERIDEEILHRAFEPFFTTKSKGTGLGLGLVKRVIEEHGGSVDLVQEGNGVRVAIRLPATQD
jgi:signal transduction histidine kinase